MSLAGHFRQIDPLPTLSACPLRSDRVRTFAPQRNHAVCHEPTDASQQKQRLFDHFVGAGEKQRRNRETQGIGRPEINDELERRRLLHWQIGGSRTS